MSKPLVITIGREYGSAGREIGRKLAADMGIKCTIGAACIGFKRKWYVRRAIS